MAAGSGEYDDGEQQNADSTTTLDSKRDSRRRRRIPDLPIPRLEAELRPRKVRSQAPSVGTRAGGAWFERDAGCEGGAVCNRLGRWPNARRLVPLVPKLQLGNASVLEALLPKPPGEAGAPQAMAFPSWSLGTRGNASVLEALLLRLPGEAGASQTFAFPSWSLGTRARTRVGRVGGCVPAVHLPSTGGGSLASASPACFA